MTYGAGIKILNMLRLLRRMIRWDWGACSWSQTQLHRFTHCQGLRDW